MRQKGTKLDHLIESELENKRITKPACTRLQRVNVGDTGQAVCALAEHGRLPRLPSVVRIRDAVSLRTHEGLDERSARKRREIVSVVSIAESVRKKTDWNPCAQCEWPFEFSKSHFFCCKSSFVAVETGANDV